MERHQRSGSNTTHTWATFGYANITLNPTWNGSITSTGPPSGTILKVLEKVTYPDLSSTKFFYNAYGQVSKIENIAADSPSHVLNSVRTNLESPGSNLTDVPRLGETRTFVENFNSGNETVVTNTLTTGHQVTDITGATVTASLIQVAMQNHPNGNITNTYVGQSGWMESLPILVNDYAEGDYYTPKRSSWTHWTQDDANSSDTQNPRVTETKIGDGVNLKRSTIEYLLYPSTTVSQFGLVSAVNVYDTDQSTVLKRAETDYNLAAVYLDRRIVGVPSVTRVFGYENSQLALVSKVTYGFDEGNFTQEQNQIITPIRHDTAKYGSSFIVGRGNLTSTTRHDVTGQTASVTSSVLYDIAGSPVAQLDPLDRKVRIEYTDVFNDTGTSRNTFAYPTRVFDPAGNYSEVKYRHDIGANVRAQSPAPAGNTQGKITEREYDSIGRLLKDKIVNLGGAYTRYEYPTNGVQAKAYTTIIDTNANGADTADEVLSESWSDGAGRVRRSRTEHPGSAGAYSGSLVEYDILGRATRQSVPTEVDSSWNPAGDDATRGFLWTHQKYDWMGRVVRKINTDGIDSPTLNDSDVLISYAGCGCAGGLETTIQSESVSRDDQPTVNARRTQKVYADILGRSYKTEVMNWDGYTPYTATFQTFNGRDQVTQTRQYAGSTSSTTYQDTTATFDGHGRLKTSHRPEQDANTSTGYNYNADDSIQRVTDAREVSTVYEYDEDLGLVTEISHLMAEPTEIPATPVVNFAYDNLGNRTTMTDGLGSVAYEYNELSQMTAETRAFTDSLPSAPLPNNSYRIEYSYHLGGQLKSLKEPYGVTVNYGMDKIGRLTNVAPSMAYGSTTSFVSNAQYTAFGALKHLEYGNGVEMNTTFDNRLQPATFNLATTSTAVMQKNYQYYADGRLKHLDDALNWRFDRLNTYDHQGRIKEAKSSNEANGGTVSNQLYDLPYRQTSTYNAFGNMTSRYNKQWAGDANLTISYTYSKNRVTSSTNGYITYTGWEHDADGRVTQSAWPDGPSEIEYDAAGQLVFKHDQSWPGIAEDKYKRFNDGDGREVKRVTERCRVMDPEDPEPECEWQGEETMYYIRSTVLNGEVMAEGGKRFVRVGGEVIAYLTHRVEFTGGPFGTRYDAAHFRHSDALGVSERVTRDYPEHIFGVPSWNPSFIDQRQAEFDASGGNVGTVTSYSPQYGSPNADFPPLEPESELFIDGQRAPCELDGMTVSCAQLIRQANSGGVAMHEIFQSRGMLGDRILGQRTWNLEPLGLGIFGVDRGSNNYKEPRQGFHWTDWTFSFNAQRQTDKIVKVPLPDNFKDLLRERLKSKQPGQTEDCNSFIARMIKYVNDKFEKELSDLRKSVNSPHTRTEPAAADGLGLVDKISKFTLVEGGVTLNGHGAGGTVSGSIGGGDAEVLMSEKWYYSPHARNVNPVAMWTKWYIGTAIHEIVHLARRGVMSDGRLAQAAHAMGDSKVEILDPDTNDITKIYKYSDAWNEALAKYCGAR